MSLDFRKHSTTDQRLTLFKGVLYPVVNLFGVFGVRPVLRFEKRMRQRYCRAVVRIPAENVRLGVEVIRVSERPQETDALVEGFLESQFWDRLDHNTGLDLLERHIVRLPRTTGLPVGVCCTVGTGSTDSSDDGERHRILGAYQTVNLYDLEEKQGIYQQVPPYLPHVELSKLSSTEYL
jgi:hypothetical protein